MFKELIILKSRLELANLCLKAVIFTRDKSQVCYSASIKQLYNQNNFRL